MVRWLWRPVYLSPCFPGEMALKVFLQAAEPFGVPSLAMDQELFNTYFTGKSIQHPAPRLSVVKKTKEEDRKIDVMEIEGRHS